MIGTKMKSSLLDQTGSKKQKLGSDNTGSKAQFIFQPTVLEDDDVASEMKQPE